MIFLPDGVAGLLDRVWRLLTGSDARTWRYNPRYQLQTMIPRFVHSAARTQPMPYRLLIAG